MVSLFRRLRDTRRRRTIRTYLVKLRPLLAERFGASDYYTPAQVTEAVQEALPPDEMHAACAIVCTPDAYAAAIGDDYWAMRVEIGAMFFGGNAGFTAQDAARMVKTRREMVDLGECFADGGGHGGVWHDGGGGHGGGHA